MTARTVRVFFYGSYMNRAVLGEADLRPDRLDVARLDEFDIRIGPRANLVPAPGRCVYGVVADATHEELARLYAHAQAVLGETYAPSPVLVQAASGTWLPALCYLAAAMTPRTPDPAYVERIVAPAREHGFPAWYIARLEAQGHPTGPGGSTLDDGVFARRPAALAAIEGETARLGFAMASEPKTGALLAALAAAKPGGRFLELGTGTGIGTSWLLDGMDAAARLETVDTDPRVVEVARAALGADARVTFHVQDGGAFLAAATPASYDLVYADAWPGKFSHLDVALALLRPGGLYVIDDLLPQANWPDGHGDKVRALVADLDARPGFTTVRLAWASGLLLAVRGS
jgi:predicted O-methyltransferase YrrM